MIGLSTMNRCFDIPWMAHQASTMGKRLEYWQINHLRKFSASKLTPRVQQYLDKFPPGDLKPQRGRKQFRMTGKELTRRISIFIDYEIFLAEEKSRSIDSFELNYLPSERASQRIVKKYCWNVSSRTVWENISMWRQDKIFVGIVVRYKAKRMH